MQLVVETLMYKNISCVEYVNEYVIAKIESKHANMHL